MIDFGVAYDKLASFETAGEIADFLQGYGIKAYPRNARACAISMWMESQTDFTTETVSTSVRCIPTWFDGERRTSPIQFIPTTAAMQDFVERYDRNSYPELVAQSKTGWGCGFGACGYGLMKAVIGKNA